MEFADLEAARNAAREASKHDGYYWYVLTHYLATAGPYTVATQGKPDERVVAMFSHGTEHK